MTEATSHHFTPFLLYLSKNEDLESTVLESIKKSFSELNDGEILWINKEKSNFSIDMVRNLTQEMSYGSYQGKVRHVILVAIDQASIEAQNALLKLLEEPPQKTQLWLTAAHSALLLPTIISRCQETTITHSSLIEFPSEIISLLNHLSSLSHRELSEFAEKYSEREDAQNLIDLMVKYAHQQLKNSPGNFSLALKTLLQTKQYLDANVNVRLALEHCLFNLKKILVI